MNLGNFGGGSKLFPKNWQKYAKIPYFSLFFSEIWGRGKFFLEKNGSYGLFYKSKFYKDKFATILNTVTF